METKSKGSIGEILAEKYLNKLGYKFLDRNFSSKLGEIDLIYIRIRTQLFLLK